MTSNRLSFASVDIDNSTLVEKFVSEVGMCPTPTRIFLPMTREAEERELGNEVVVYILSG